MTQTLNKAETKQRNYGIDLIKIVAFCLVVTVHFFLYTEYYNTPLSGLQLFFFTNIRNLAMCCVPLFITVTGYLMAEKTLSKNYYWGMAKTLLTLFFAEIFCCLYDSIVFVGKPFWSQLLKMGEVHYAWYIDMYIGLFLIIPFLNMAFQGAKDKKIHLVVSFVIITMAIPTITSAFELPQGWWKEMYPLTYYFIGCYIKENAKKIKGVICLLTAIASILALSTIQFIIFKHHVISGFVPLSYHNSVFICMATISLFLLIVKSNNKISRSKSLKAITKYISELTLGAYLISYVVDDIVYEIVDNYWNLNENMLIVFPMVIPSVIIASLCMSFVINFFSKTAMELINKIRYKRA